MIKVKSFLLGDRIDLKGLENRFEAVAFAPLTFEINDNGYVVLFKYGVIVTFNLDEISQTEFISSISHLILGKYENVLSEETNVDICDSDKDDLITKDGDIILNGFDILKFQLIANVLSEATVLDYYEAKAANVIDVIEPMVNMLSEKGKISVSGKSLSKLIADVMLTYTKLVARVGVGEKPDALWDFPYMDRFYARLVEEYELLYRDKALTRRLELMSDTVETLLGVDQHKYSSRLEWYIILLIVAEVVIMLLSELVK
ncbi:MAG: hypothetical protein BWY78_00118 [Alphaproteobacteria bacterium ADurb.Bin438]|nr:MAG: hypothetical protein BWY78_00118 [Alphaproteobacteria bacterium ADurb.Bin438]